MERKDYLMRYFDQLGEVIARLMGFRKRKDWEHAHEYLDEVSNDFLELDINELETIDSTGIIDFLMKKDFTLEKFKVLAEFLNEKGEIYFQQFNVQKAMLFFNHSLAVFRHVDETEKTFSMERNQKMNFIDQRLSEIEVNE